MPKVPDHPTIDDARKAIDLLEGLLKEFQFIDEGESKSVALSGLMTPIVRPALGCVPLHVFSAPDIGGGKSYLAHCCATLGTGFKAPAISLGKDEAETEKRLGTALVDGSPIVLIDNVSRTLRGDFLCIAIDQPRLKIRLLGFTKDIEVEPCCTFFATGNNIQIGGDLVRRTIECRTDPGVENAWERSFQQNPLAMIRENRGRYIAAVLTICRAFRLSGEKPITPALASFEEWSDLIRSALTWLDRADPVASMTALRQNDPERDHHLQVANAWMTTIGIKKEMTTMAAVEVATGLNSFSGNPNHPELLAAVLAVAKEHNGSNPSSARLGHWLKRHQDRIVAGMVFRRGDKAAGGYLWQLERK